jgi:hypothetical protein
MSLDVDTREFNAAMKEAVRTSNRSAATVINGKLQDLMYKSGKETPSAKKTYKRQFISNPPAFVTNMATQQYGKGFKRAQRSDIWGRWWPAKSGKSFLKSGFIIAGKKIKRANAIRAGKQYPESVTSGGRPIRASVREAGGTSAVVVASSEIRWKAKRQPGDEPGKERILFAAMLRGMATVTADTRRHMAEKLAKDLAKVSARGAR